MAGSVASEGADLPSPNLPNNQNKMLEALLPVHPSTVLVLKDSTPMMMPWIDKAKAVLEAWNQGTEDGHVVADLLFGNVNPSGKVPTTYAASEADLLYAGHPERYPGTDEGEGYPVIRYSEGLNMGYRWFQSQGKKPLFPFGFGLSYTTFKLSDFSVSPQQPVGQSPTTVSITVENTGKVAGAEVVQVYLGIPVVGQPPKRLVAFQKVFLDPGQTRKLPLTIDPAAPHHPMSVWDDAAHDFVVKPGDYYIYIGT